MSNWTREYGTDSEGRRAIIITEKTPQKVYEPFITKVLKFGTMVGLGLVVLFFLLTRLL